MTHEQLLNIACVFIMNHREEFIADHVMESTFFGMDSHEAFVEGEKIYDELVEHILKQF